MSFGIRIWDARGDVIFDDEYLSMRVLGVVKVRDATLRSVPMDVATKLAGPGVIAMVMPVASAYRLGWGVYYGDSHLAEMPVVTVHNGYIRLAPFNDGRLSSAYRANMDVALVMTS